MANGDQIPFSPFYAVKKVLLALRWFLGFPLKPTNETFSQFSFNPCLEYSRHILYIFISSVSAVSLCYLYLKIENTKSPSIAVEQFIKRTGISNLDAAILFWLPLVNLVSSTLYLNSFRRTQEGINKISRSLTHVAEELYSLVRKTKFTSYWPEFKHACTFCALISIITCFGPAIFTVCFYNIFVNGNFNLSTVHKISFCLSTFIFNISWIYPPMAISADFIVCHLLKETKHAFDKFKIMMKQGNKLHVNEESKQKSIFLRFFKR